MKPLRKAIFPVAGWGTRFLPATKSIPKEMLTIVDKPLIQYAVDEALDAGCDQLIFITGKNKRAISDYFDRHYELESALELSGKLEALNLIRDIVPNHVRCTYVMQSSPLGLGHAIQCAEHLILDDEPFAVLLPDDLIDGEPGSCLRQMREIHESENGASVIAVEEVPYSDIHRYGIVSSANGYKSPFRINRIIEKPSAPEAPSNWAVVGRYILSANVMKALRTRSPGIGGELQLTDAIADSLESDPYLGYAFRGKRFDCGNKIGFLEANMHFGLKQCGNFK